MKLLEELENKVLLLIQKNKDLQSEISKLRESNRNLVEQNKRLELSSMRSGNDVESLNKERDEIKNSIEELLSSMETLEKASSKNT